MSTVFAEHHVLASSHGYATVHASKGLTNEEKQSLEVLGFGQTDEAEYLGSIQRHPAAFGRRLRSGRYAITRCLGGESDSAGRQTLRFSTLVVSQDDWLSFVSRGLQNIIKDESIWSLVGKSNERIGIPIKLEDQVGTDLRDFAIAAVDAVIVSGPDQTSFLEDSELSSQAVMLSVGILPDDLRAKVVWGVRVLSNGYRFDICSVSRFADLGGRRRAVQISRKAQLQSKYASALRHFWSVSGKTPYALSSATEASLSTDSGARPNQRTSSLGSRFKVVLTGSVALIGLCVVVAYLLQTQRPSETKQPIAASDEPQAAQQQILERGHFEIGQQTPNETEAATLLDEFSQSGQWSLDELRQWHLKARSIFHADAVIGFSKAVEDTRLAIVWAEKVLGVKKDINAFMNEVESQHGPFVWFGKGSELRRYQDLLIADSQGQIDQIFPRLYHDVLEVSLSFVRSAAEEVERLEETLTKNSLLQEPEVPAKVDQTSDEHNESSQGRGTPAPESRQMPSIEQVQRMLQTKDANLLTMKELRFWWNKSSLQNSPDRLRNVEWILSATELRVKYLSTNRESLEQELLREECLILLDELSAERLGFGPSTAQAAKINKIRTLASSLDDLMKEEPGDE